jgi:hypothetical protein
MMIIKMENGIGLKKFLKITLIIFFLVLLFSYEIKADNTKGYLGVLLHDVSDEFLEINNLDKNLPKSIIITNIQKNSPAHLANIKPGDIIVSVDNIEVKVIEDFLTYLEGKKPGENINIKFFRNKDYFLKKIILGKYPDKEIESAWLVKDDLFKRTKEKLYTLDDIWFGLKKNILYPNYFSEEILKKYNHDNITVVCVQKSRGKTLRLYDQIVTINNERAINVLPIRSNEELKVTVIRNNRNITLNIKPELPSDFDSQELNCTPEFANIQCDYELYKAFSVGDSDSRIITDDKILAFRKVLDCYVDNKVSVIPFSDYVSEGLVPKFTTYSSYLYNLQYQYKSSSLEGQKNVKEIKRVLSLLKADILEFDKFAKIYPNHNMQKEYDKILEKFSSVTARAGSSYQDIFNSTKNDTMNTDSLIVEKTKKALEDLVKEKTFNDIETIKFLTRNQAFFRKSNENEYLFSKFEQAESQINWEQVELKELFSDFYFDLISISNEMKKYDQTMKYLEKAINISESNYNDLFFKEAYGRFISLKYIVELTSLAKFDKNFFSKAEKHINHLESLSEEDKEKLFKLRSNYYVDIVQSLYSSSLLLKNNKRKLTYWPTKGLQFIKSHEEEGFNFSYPLILEQLLQSSIVEDDRDSFILANNELKILYSKSRDNKYKLYSLLNASASILGTYNLSNYYYEADKYLEFINNTFDLKEYAKDSNGLATLITYYQGFSHYRKKEFKKAIEVLEYGFSLSKAEDYLSNKNANIEQVFAISKIAPLLAELYVKEKKFTKLESLFQLFHSKNIYQIDKKSLDDAYNFLTFNSLKYFKTLLLFYESKNYPEGFKFVEKYFEKKLNKMISEIGSDNVNLGLYAQMSKSQAYDELAQISFILIQNGYQKKGYEILNKNISFSY